MFTQNKSRLWDVGADGSVKPIPLQLESDRENALQISSDRKVTTGIVAGYAGAGGALAWWWGSSGVFGFLASAATWPLILAWKVVMAMFLPSLLIGAVGLGALYYFKKHLRLK